jgi:RNA polymerase subunit RPABC4/transcription elongation factor Spt4
MAKYFDEYVREFITTAADGVQLDGLCPICGTGRSQNGECWRGHIVIDVNKSATVKALRQQSAQHSAQQTCSRCNDTGWYMDNSQAAHKCDHLASASR